MLISLSSKAVFGMKLLAAALLFLASVELPHSSPWSVVWTTPCILGASLLITWGAESAQFFVAQGFALAILAWMQTLPEFAVEGVLAWKQQRALLLANLTGALRLLTGLAWPMIYMTAAVQHRRRTGQPLRKIYLNPHQSVEVMGLVLPLLYAFLIWWKSRLEVYDAGILIAVYVAYLLLLTRLPAEKHEGMEDLGAIPRRIVCARPRVRTSAILGCFLLGGILIYFVAEPFLGSLVALATAVGIPAFVVIQWLAPVISEFPELLSTFYFARQQDKASVAIMNIASSNINQWTLLVGMLPIALSLGAGSISTIEFDAEQQAELLLTISQSVVGLLMLLNMEFDWWEAAGIFGLFVAQFVLPPWAGNQAKDLISYVFLLWAAVQIGILIAQRTTPAAFLRFGETWQAHVRTSTAK
jgi:cation:H+ antiporter